MNEMNSEVNMDPTEGFRRDEIERINSEAGERDRLESLYPQVWDTAQVSSDFEVLSFLAPFVMVRRKSDNQKGSLMFQHNPRFYFNFQSV